MRLTIILLISLCLLGAGGLFYKEVNRQHVVASKEMRQVVDAMMADFYLGQAASVKGVAPDGKWYNRIFFIRDQKGPVAYSVSKPPKVKLYREGQDGRFIATQIADFKIRRIQEDTTLFEVELKTEGLFPLTSHFKVRMAG